MLFGFAGFTATKGSTSLLTKFVPGPPTVQLANGLRPETSIGPAAASAIPATAIAATAVMPAMIQRKRRMPHLPRADMRRAISLCLTHFNARAARRDADQVTRRIAHGLVAKERPISRAFRSSGAGFEPSTSGYEPPPLGCGLGFITWELQAVLVRFGAETSATLRLRTVSGCRPEGC